MDHKDSTDVPPHCTARLAPKLALRGERRGHALRSPSSRCEKFSSATNAHQLPQPDDAMTMGTGAIILWPLSDDDDPSPPVVSTALSLWAKQPRLPALEVLDRAMLAHAGEDLDFQFDGERELAAPHPFAELIRRAFAPRLDPIELCMSFVEGDLEDRQLRERITRARRRWAQVILRFAERYRIWEPEN